MAGKPITVVVVGAGHRSVRYAQYALEHPERMKVVAVCEPRQERREEMGKLHKIPPEMLFKSHLDLLTRPLLADAVINGTMDKQHYETALPLLEKRYHMLLEKPIAPTEREVRGLIEAAAKRGVKVMICHVLRYAPFYSRIKDAIVRGEIGDVVSIHTSERVSYHHMAVGFIRGKWNQAKTSNPMLLAKCCHDLDIIAWLMSGTAPVRVSSFGSLKQFRPANAPAGSAKRCLDGCGIEATCPYSARANYVDSTWWEFYPWEGVEDRGKMSREQRLEYLKKDSPFGRCVWHCDNDVVDHQSVLVEFKDGVTATHDMFCATARPTRTIHIVGSRGEIEGDMEAGRISTKKPAPKGPDLGFTEEEIDVLVKGDPHGGGDGLLVADFVSVLKGESASLGATRIEDSLAGHLMAFKADEAMVGKKVVEVGF